MALRPTTRLTLLTPNSPSTLTTTRSPHLAPLQKRHANFIPRPRRPYTFTQLVVLSDGSTYQHRTSSPMPVYKSVKDTRNSPLWNPTSEKLSNMEVDEAGRLAAFRERFGRGWDAKSGHSEEVAKESEELEDEQGREEDGGLMDLITGYAGVEEKDMVKGEAVAGKGKGTGSKKEWTAKQGKPR